MKKITPCWLAESSADQVQYSAKSVIHQSKKCDTHANYTSRFWIMIA